MFADLVIQMSVRRRIYDTQTVPQNTDRITIGIQRLSVSERVNATSHPGDNNQAIPNPMAATINRKMVKRFEFTGTPYFPKRFAFRKALRFSIFLLKTPL